MTDDTPLLKVDELRKHFQVGRRRAFGRTPLLRAVDGVSFDIAHGETLGLVGESGCGKSTTGRLIVGLMPPTSGSVRFNDGDVDTVDGRAPRAHRRRSQFIFQDPYGSLNPRMTVERIISEPIDIAGGVDRVARRKRVAELLDIVGLADHHATRYPHEFSGGQRQRIGIARALALNPKFIVCDEPVSALDVSVQAQVLNLMLRLQREFNLTYLFIAHDLAVVRQISNRIAVMYLGKIVEIAERAALFDDPLHPYTQALLASVPVSRPGTSRRRVPLQGDVPSPVNPPKGCRFHTRCPLAFDRCRVDEPPLAQISGSHSVACHLVKRSDC
ncbi:dipeptide ABC transporter ATP-binding protein [Pikeienuella sp. HZG-20]|uniref:ABC transporter ATP-binding protein n=1 Tax=Paludibacillus litoralis TaxID=3133267 RepID=UPI0030EE9CFB